MSNKITFEVDKYIENLIENKFTTGMRVKVKKNKTEVFVNDYGHRNLAGDIFDDKSLFKLFSMTKPVTATAFMILIEMYNKSSEKFISEITRNKIEKIITKEVYIKDFYKEWSKENLKMSDGGIVENDISLFNLFTMTSGIPYVNISAFSDLIKWKAIQGDMETYAKFLINLNLLTQPGTAWNYGQNFELLACIGDKILKNVDIDGINSKNWIDFVDEYLLKKIGAENSFYAKKLEQVNIENLVSPNQLLDGNLVEEKDSWRLALAMIVFNFYSWESNIDQEQKSAMGGTCFITTIDDYVLFNQLLLDGLDKDGNKILSDESLKEMRTNHLSEEIYSKAAQLNDGFGYGYGMRVKVKDSNVMPNVPNGSFGWDGYLYTNFLLNFELQTIACVMMQKYTLDYSENAKIMNIIYKDLIENNN